MMNEPQLSAEDSLKLIQEMIRKAKRSYITKGIAPIVWGSLIIFCSLVTWAEIVFSLKTSFDVWLLLMLALIPQIYFTIKEKRSKDFISHDGDTVSFIWIAFTVCIFITSFYDGKYGGEGSAALYMMLYGIPTFLTGGIFKFKPMILGGTLCWLLSVISMFTNDSIDMLLMAACGLFAWVIPGVILWNRYKKQQANV